MALRQFLLQQGVLVGDGFRRAGGTRFGGISDERPLDLKYNSLFYDGQLTHGRYKRAFWGGAIGLSVLTAILAFIGAINEGLGLLAVLAGVIAQASLLIYESAYVKAGQDVPLS